MNGRKRGFLQEQIHPEPKTFYYLHSSFPHTRAGDRPEMINEPLGLARAYTVRLGELHRISIEFGNQAI